MKGGEIDIKADNILHAIVDKGILEAFVKEEMESPSPRKFVDGAPVYMSRRFGLHEDFGRIMLSDFESTVRGDLRRNHDAQPDVYRTVARGDDQGRVELPHRHLERRRHDLGRV